MKDLGLSAAFTGLVVLAGVGFYQLAETTSPVMSITVLGALLLLGGFAVAVAAAGGSA